VFGLGLIVSRHGQPGQVLGFSGSGRRLGPVARAGHGRRHRGKDRAFALAKKRSVSLLGAPSKLPTATRCGLDWWSAAACLRISWGVAGFFAWAAKLRSGWGGQGSRVCAGRFSWDAEGVSSAGSGHASTVVLFPSWSGATVTIGICWPRRALLSAVTEDGAGVDPLVVILFASCVLSLTMRSTLR
jgi:hypothetical protein